MKRKTKIEKRIDQIVAAAFFGGILVTMGLMSIFTCIKNPGYGIFSLILGILDIIACYAWTNNLKKELK